LAKRAIIGTRTVVIDGETVVEVLDAVATTLDVTSTITKTNVVTETEASFIRKLFIRFLY
jgi:hypothetical protein